MPLFPWVKSAHDGGSSRAEARPFANTRTASSIDEKRLVELCTCSIDELYTRIESSALGLDSKDADKRLSSYGPNEFSRARHRSLIADLFERFRSPLVLQLLVIATVSALMGQMVSSIIVGSMILLSVGLSFILDQRSNNEVEALGKRVQSRS